MDSTQPGKHFERERCSENEGSAAEESDQLCAHNVTECVSTKEPQVSEELDTFCRESGWRLREYCGYRHHFASHSPVRIRVRRRCRDRLSTIAGRCG